MSIFFKILLVLQNYPSTHFKTDQNIISIEKLPDFDSKEYEICLRWKKCILKQIYQNHWISFAIKLLDVDLVLAKISQIDPRLTFNLLYIFNHGRISKIEKKHLIVQILFEKYKDLGMSRVNQNLPEETKVKHVLGGWSKIWTDYHHWFLFSR